MSQKTGRRITVKLAHPNPLFEQWLTEWKNEAAAVNSKLQFTYSAALKSLKKFPLPLQSGRECKILKGFGDVLCSKLDEKLSVYRNTRVDNEDSVEAMPGKKAKVVEAKPETTLSNLNDSRKAKASKSMRSPKSYVPEWRSGPYAILIAMYKHSLEVDYPGFLTKAQIIQEAQSLCDVSFTKPNPGSFYTAWSSVRILLNKDLLTKVSNPAKFSLTDAGLVIAHKLYRNSLNSENDDPQIPSRGLGITRQPSSSTSLKPNSSYSSSSITQSSSSNSLTSNSQASTSKFPKYSSSSLKTVSSSSLNSEALSHFEFFQFDPYSFDVILLVDKQESTGCLDDPLLELLVKSNVTFETRHLKVGDYAWVCRQGAKELVLPYIVERKRMDDLAASIKDGRFYEQKFRLKQCGLQNLIYLVENYGDNLHTGLPLPHLLQAATNTLVCDNFSVKFVDGLKGTARHLACLTATVNSHYRGKTIVSCAKENLMSCGIEDDLVTLMTFSEFNKGASKRRNFSAKQLFIRQLVKLNGLSVERALPIVEKYPTLQLLLDAYDNCGNNIEKEKLLANVKYGKLGKKIGAVISKTLYQLYQERF